MKEHTDALKELAEAMSLTWREAVASVPEGKPSYLDSILNPSLKDKEH